MSMTTCQSCKGFIPAGHASCPNCNARAVSPSSRARKILGVIGGITVPFTLMACYGGPPVTCDTDAGETGCAALPDGGNGDGGTDGGGTSGADGGGTSDGG